MTKNKNTKKLDVGTAIGLFRRYYPDAHCALNHNNAFELLVATILSAQCTDERVNQVTPALFKKYPNPASLSKAEIKDIEKLIHSTGFYKNKAKNLKSCAEALVQTHSGQVPDSLEELVQLAGVGRKTANVVLGNAFGIASGVVVDTHVTRLAGRFGWVSTKDAVAIEKILNQLVPKSEWILISHWLISHGRAVCKARNPQCNVCFLSDICPRRGL